MVMCGWKMCRDQSSGLLAFFVFTCEKCQNTTRTGVLLISTHGNRGNCTFMFFLKLSLTFANLETPGRLENRVERERVDCKCLQRRTQKVDNLNTQHDLTL